MQNHTVTIRLRPNSTPQPDELYYDGRRKIASTWQRGKRDIRRGLDHDEEKKYLPNLIGTSANDPKFSEEVRKFWANLELEVPEKGVELDVSIDDNEMPVNLRDYVLYRFALADSRVAKSESAMRADQLALWYIDDPAERLAAESARLNQHKKAMKAYLEVTSDESQMDWLLLLLGATEEAAINHDVKSLSRSEKDIMLEAYTRKRTDDFIRFAGDKDLQLKAGIEQAVSRGIFDRQNQAYYYGDIKMGNTLEEAVRFLKDKANSSVMLLMKESLELFSVDLLSANTQKEIRSTASRKEEKAKEPVLEAQENDTNGDEPGSEAGASEG